LVSRVTAASGFLRGAGFAGDDVLVERSVFTRAARDDGLENLVEHGCSFFGDDALRRGTFRRIDDAPVRVDDAVDDARLDADAAIRNGRDCAYDLQRRDADLLPDRHRGIRQLRPASNAAHESDLFARQRNACALAASELAAGAIEPFVTEGTAATK